MALGESSVYRKPMEQLHVYVELVTYSAATSADGKASTSLIRARWQRCIENSFITLSPVTIKDDLLNSIINNSIIVYTSEGEMGAVTKKCGLCVGLCMYSIHFSTSKHINFKVCKMYGARRKVSDTRFTLAINICHINYSRTSAAFFFHE